MLKKMFRYGIYSIILANLSLFLGNGAYRN